MNYFHLSFDEILWGRSVFNLIMLAASVPSVGTKEDMEEAGTKEDPKEVNDMNELLRLMK